jgi:hypothetical protein
MAMQKLVLRRHRFHENAAPPGMAINPASERVEPAAIVSAYLNKDSRAAGGREPVPGYADRITEVGTAE